jgi:hypothetical protein
MKLFKAELSFKSKRGGRAGVELIVHARSRATVEDYLRGKYTACKIVSVIQLSSTVTKHFVIADLIDD